MNVVDYSQMSAEALIQAFVVNSQRIGSAWNFPIKVHPKSPEWEAVAREICAINAELETRNSVALVRRLFDHESRDVRGWAAGQFAEFDPEWACATLGGLAEDLSTREVLALSARAQQGPPTHPALEDMSMDQLIARFEDAAIRNYATRFILQDDGLRDVELNNRIVREILAIGRQLKSRNALAGLLPLLESSNITVRHHAARNCLAIAPERAAPVLEAVAASGDPYELGGASRTLERWRAGELK